MIVSEIDLNRMVTDLVPEKYWPDKGGKNIVSNISAVNSSIIKGFLKLTKSKITAKDTFAICLNWGKLKKITGFKDWEKEAHTYGIFIDEDLPCGLLGCTFVLLHEIGHVDWHTRRKELKKWADDERELYADFYATEKLAAKYGRDTATTLATRFGSKHGLRRRIENA